MNSLNIPVMWKKYTVCFEEIVQISYAKNIVHIILNFRKIKIHDTFKFIFPILFRNLLSSLL